MTLLISIAIAMLAGLALTRLTNLFRMPDVTAYLIAGILIGPFCLGRLGVPGLGFTTYDEVNALNLLSNLALGFIAFAIGSEFMLPKLRSIGRQAVVIAIFQACLASVLVCGALIAVHFIAPDKISLPAAITLGAVASATAPAATLMVVRQYKAKGPVTDILMPVVALDDAVGLVLFAVALGIAKAVQGGAISVISILVNPLLEIVCSLALGTVLGILLHDAEKFFHSNRNRVILLIGIVTLTVGLSMLKFEIGEIHIGFSALLVCMMLGTVFCNVCPIAEDLMEREDRWTAPIYCLFFVMSGAALDLTVFADIAMVAIGLVYIVFRSAGKYFGAGWSAKAMHCDPRVTKYLGITLLPQAGVALGMSLTATEVLGAAGSTIRSITLFSVLIYELVGPSLSKMALTAAGDIQPKSEEVKNRRQKLLEEKGHQCLLRKRT